MAQEEGSEEQQVVLCMVDNRYTEEAKQPNMTQGKLQWPTPILPCTTGVKPLVDNRGGELEVTQGPINQVSTLLAHPFLHSIFTLNR